MARWQQGGMIEPTDETAWEPRHFATSASGARGASGAPGPVATAAASEGTDETDGTEGTRVAGARSAVGAALGLVGVAGLAVTQPVLDLFGRNPEFFVAGRYGAGQIITFALVVGLVPGLVAVALSSGARLIHPGLGAVVHATLLAVLAFLFGLVLAGQVGLDGMWTGLLVAAVVAGLVVWLERTRQPMRTLLSYLALGNLVFVALFLFASPTAELVATRAGASGGGGGAAVTMPGLRGPVVFVILDELPITTIMRPDGTINAARYPNFARLAESSTWFRNASALSSMTSESVPAMLTGTRPAEGDLPSYIDNPLSYFTLFGDRYPVGLYESVTDMCPPSVCVPAKRGSVGTALKDGLVVYGRQVLPGNLAEDLDLPSVDHSWGGFGDELGSGADASAGSAEAQADVDAAMDSTAAAMDSTDADADSDADADPQARPAPGTPGPTTSTGSSEAADGIVGENGYGRWETLSPDERRADGQRVVLRDSVARIGPEPSVNFVHVALPHYPWILTPWGTRLSRTPPRIDDTDGSEAREANGRLHYQLHSMQVGAADAAVGEMIDHLEAVGAWDDALVVVASDHGTSLFLPDFGREPSKRNAEERLRMTLFVKAPGQTRGEGEVRDEVAQTIDILPSIVDLLGAETGEDWRFDGHSLYDGSEPGRAPVVDDSILPALDLAARHAADYGGDDWDGLAALGTGRDLDLVGRPVAGLVVGSPSQMTWTAKDESLLASLPTEDGRVPQLLVGQVTTPDGEEPPEILLAVNGTIAGVAALRLPADDAWQVMGMVGPHFRLGANTVEAFEVEVTPSGPVLHRLASLG